MKLRIKNNSIRYRLDKNDIQELGEKGFVEGRTEIGADLFVYTLQGSDELQMNCTLGTNKITIYLPTTQIKEWIASERVGYEHQMPLQSGNKLHLLLEKDFKCLDDTIEDQSNNYDNPLLNKKG